MGNCQNQDQNQHNFIQNNKNTQPGCVSELKITNYIWQQDYQGLFDFDTKQILKKTLKIQGSAILSKTPTQHKYQLFDQNVQKLNSQQVKNCLFRILRKDKMYIIEPLFIQMENGMGVQRLLWLVVSSLPKERHRVQEKDIVKLGKQKIRVREICHVDSNASGLQEIPKLSKTVYQNLTQQQTLTKTIQQQPTPLKKPQNTALQLSQQTNSQQVCRICLDPGQHTNPLITPCKCSGSVRYIHLVCLRMWLSKRLNIQKSQHCITINWLPLSCQMCKSGFKYRIYLDNKKFYTVDIPKPEKPYIIVQLMKKTSSGNGKIFHFISFANKNKITLGRRKDIDVRVSEDISISRAHAVLEYVAQEKSFYLYDNKSKFGTLTLIKKGLLIKPEYKNISLQLGAEIFSFQSSKNAENGDKKQENQTNQQYLAENMSQYEDQDDDEEGLENSDDQEIENGNGNNGNGLEEGEGVPTNQNISGVSGGNGGRSPVQNR